MKPARIGERLGILDTKVDTLTTSFKEFADRVDEKLVTKAEFFPVKLIAFGTVGLIVIAVFTAMIATVVRASL